MFRSSSYLLLALALCAGLPSRALAQDPPPADAKAQVEQAEALHLDEKYPAALQAYDRLIAEHPAWLRPRYLRWILRVDMGDLAALEKELGLAAGVSFESMTAAAFARLPAELASGKDNPRPWLHAVACRYLEAKAAAAPAGNARTEATTRILAVRDLPLDLRLRLEDTLPELDRAEAAHLAHRYACALQRYDAIIAKDQTAFRPRYLRWILMVDMGALSVLERELGLDAQLPFKESVNRAAGRMPHQSRRPAEDPIPWLRKVATRYYESKFVQVANRSDTPLAIKLAQSALADAGLPRELRRDLEENLAVFLGESGQFSETVAAVDAFEKQYGEPALGLLKLKAASLLALDRHAEAGAAWHRVRERLAKANATPAELLPALRGEYTAARDAGDLDWAHALLDEISAATPLPQPARKGCAPDWSGDYAWTRLQEVCLLMQEKKLAEADAALDALEVDFSGAPDVVFLRANLEHLRGRPKLALAFYHRLEAEQTEPDPRTVAGRLAAQSDAGSGAQKNAARAELAQWRQSLPSNPEFALLEARFLREDKGAGRPSAAGQDAPAPAVWQPDQPWNPGEVMALCYHDIPDQAARGDSYAVDVETFVSHLEMLKAKGFHFIRLSDLIAAQRAGGPALPDKSALLTFDDGYATHHDNLLPILELYQAPATLAVVTRWIGQSKDHCDCGADLSTFPPFMTEAQLRDAARHPLIEIACHSHDLHHAETMNAFGNTAPAALTRRWTKAGGYETDGAYAARIQGDLATNVRAVRTMTGRTPAGIAWPYGAHNDATDAMARQAGLTALMDLGDGTFRPEDFPNIPRYLLFHYLRQSDLAHDISQHAHHTPPLRGQYLPLDGLVTRQDDITSQNLNLVVSQITRQRPSHVMLDVSSPTLGPCFPTGYPQVADGKTPPRDWVSHIARALEVRDLAVILRITERDRRHLDAILKLPVGNDIFLDFNATEAEVEKARGMRTEGRVLVRVGGAKNADLFVCGERDGDSNALSGPSASLQVFWCPHEAAIRRAAAFGARHWIGMSDNRFNTTRSFMTRPPADPHWLMMPPAPGPKP